MMSFKPRVIATAIALACAPGLQLALISGLAACRPLRGASYGAPELDDGAGPLNGAP